MFDLEEEKLLSEIEGRGARKILIQLPDGLKQEGPRLAEMIRAKTGAEVFVSATPAWGACDLSLDAAQRLKADLLVHYGHNEFLRDGSNGVPVVYIPAKGRHETVPLVEKAIPLLRGRRVGLATTIQHLHTIDAMKKYLEGKGFEVMVPGRGPWAHEQGQTLGCDYFGLKRIQTQLEDKGKRAVLFYADEIVPEKLLDFTDIDVFVDTACPRLALDDPERFRKPIVTRDEIMVAVGAWTWEELLERGLVRL